MRKLTYDELILLNNLIYLQLNAKENEKLIDIVERLLNNESFDNIDNCSIRMPKKEWVNILVQIKNKSNLKNLRIRDIDNFKELIRFACFVDEKNNATAVFRGTVTIKEWEDNGQGAYEYDTKEQIDALNYINSLEFNDITITGHSKGGNKAQYVTILSSKINKCISVNGQGFSNEFINKYKDEIQKNKSKIVCINSKYDYVYCLFNSISENYHYIETEIQINPLDYHKLNILLDEDGNLREETSEGAISRIINHFSISIISDLPKDIRILIVNAIIDVIELILCGGENENNIIKDVGKLLIMVCHENCFKYKEIFNIAYAILQAIIVPFIFWGELIIAEKSQSRELLSKVINKINVLENGIIKKMQIIDKDSINIINSISKAVIVLTSELENEILISKIN
ncbi:hypothetical protein CLPUN_51510 [Clostridium puniceum]|uniref:DUF2974 domain-containing protein n=1 Tax=Clostridium puniceum TaxID=29367 RepID=A0A1S8SYZ5_9CLOT|nr:Mbeg1-like protein [Clostridium puniceum]OOM70737.1 hypothetical protein CLPUN_51510 [Clostridium puniceum]